MKSITEKQTLEVRCPECNNKTILMRVGDVHRIHCSCGKRTKWRKVNTHSRTDLIEELNEKKKV